MSHTLKDTLLAALRKRGWTVIPGRSSRYTTLCHSKRPWFTFVGANGALRAGLTSSTSRSLENSTLRATLLREGEEILSGKSIDIPSI